MNIDENRLIAWVGSVNEENLKRVATRMSSLKKSNPGKEIFLIVNSLGGSAGLAFNFYDWVKLLRVNLVTIGSGDVASAGVIVFLAGKKRLLTRHTSIFLHEAGRKMSDARYDVTEIRSTHDGLLRTQSLYTDILADNSTFKKKEITKLLEHEKTLTPKEAVEMGFADKII